MHCIVRGRVQGVCFRMCARDEAARLGLTGWVRNRPEGSVELTAEGDAGDLARLVDWCRQGPPMACVTGLAVDDMEPTGEFAAFRIIG